MFLTDSLEENYEILNYLFAFIRASMACNKAVKEVGVSDTKEAKKDELVLSSLQIKN